MRITVRLCKMPLAFQWEDTIYGNRQAAVIFSHNPDTKFIFFFRKSVHIWVFWKLLTSICLITLGLMGKGAHYKGSSCPDVVTHTWNVSIQQLG